MIRTLAPLPARRTPSLPPVDSASRSSIRILVVDDERTLRESCHSVLQAEGYNVVVCGRGNEARDTLRRRPFDITLVDWFMGEVPGSELLQTALGTNPATIVIIMTGNPSVASSLEALQAGAWDYLPKPFPGTQLQILVGRAAHAVLVARESRALEEQRAQHPVDGDRIAVLGDAPLFRKAIALARRVAATDASVFLTGESGAGNVRFIAATNTNPEQAVQSALLREDLYYRLRVVPIHVPSLRERPEDIPLLADRFLSHYWGRHRDPTTPVPKLSKGALRALGAHAWPGNVRELQNVIEHAVVLLEPGAELRPEDIPFIDSGAADPEKLADEEPEGDGSSYYAARDRLLARFDRRYLTRVVMRAGGNLSKAARLAQVDRTTFYRLMERHGLQRDLLTGGAE